MQPFRYVVGRGIDVLAEGAGPMMIPVPWAFSHRSRTALMVVVLPVPAVPMTASMALLLPSTLSVASAWSGLSAWPSRVRAPPKRGTLCAHLQRQRSFHDRLPGHLFLPILID